MNTLFIINRILRFLVIFLFTLLFSNCSKNNNGDGGGIDIGYTQDPIIWPTAFNSVSYNQYQNDIEKTFDNMKSIENEYMKNWSMADYQDFLQIEKDLFNALERGIIRYIKSKTMLTVIINIDDKTKPKSCYRKSKNDNEVSVTRAGLIEELLPLTFSCYTSNVLTNINERQRNLFHQSLENAIHQMVETNRYSNTILPQVK